MIFASFSAMFGFSGTEKPLPAKHSARSSAARRRAVCCMIGTSNMLKGETLKTNPATASTMNALLAERSRAASASA